MYGGPPPPGFRPPNGFPPFPPGPSGPGGPGSQPGGFQPPPGMPLPTLPPSGMPRGNFPPFPPSHGMSMPMPNFPPNGPPHFAPPNQHQHQHNRGSPGQGAYSGAGSPMAVGMGMGGGMQAPPGGSPMNYQGGPPPTGPGGGQPNMYPPRSSQHHGVGYGNGNGNGNGNGSGNGNGTPGGGPSSFDPSQVGLPTRPSSGQHQSQNQHQHQHQNQNQNQKNTSMSQPETKAKTTAVFVGGIPGGITDQILQGLLQTCGPVHKINRVKGPSGKPQAFGFAEFEDPEVVLRVLKALNGVELPDITPEGRRNGTKKTLVVKADDKTKAFLTDYEESAMRTEADMESDESAKKRVENIIRGLNDPSADLASIIPASAAPDVDESAKKTMDDPFLVPEHLRDLDEQELPENQRAVVLDSIALFRDKTAKKEAEKRRMEEERDARRHAQMAAQLASETRPIGDGPQSYNKPVAFVKSNGPEGHGHGHGHGHVERTDEEEEELRQKNKRRRLDQELRDRERRVEARERQLFDRLGKEANMLQQEDQVLKQDREAMHKMLASWDDDLKISSGREIFYADRGRWRSHRQATRRKEYQEDVRDRQHEADEQMALEKESEDFLQKQMEEMAEIEAKQRAAGFLFSEGAPIKVTAQPTAIKVEPNVVPGARKAKAAAAAAFGAEDDEEEEKAKRRTLIKLDEDDGLTDAERAQKRQDKLEEIKAGLPTDKEGLWAYPLKWELISQDIIERKILLFVRQKMVDALGELDDDELVNFVLQHVREKASPDVIVEGLEPVFDEEAVPFVVGLWRQLAFESAAISSGVPTGDTWV